MEFPDAMNVWQDDRHNFIDSRSFMMTMNGFAEGSFGYDDLEMVITGPYEL